MSDLAGFLLVALPLTPLLGSALVRPGGDRRAPLVCLGLTLCMALLLLLELAFAEQGVSDPFESIAWLHVGLLDIVFRLRADRAGGVLIVYASAMALAAFFAGARLEPSGAARPERSLLLSLGLVVTIVLVDEWIVPAGLLLLLTYREALFVPDRSRRLLGLTVTHLADWLLLVGAILIEASRSRLQLPNLGVWEDDFRGPALGPLLWIAGLVGKTFSLAPADLGSRHHSAMTRLWQPASFPIVVTYLAASRLHVLITDSGRDKLVWLLLLLVTVAVLRTWWSSSEGTKLRCFWVANGGLILLALAFRSPTAIGLALGQLMITGFAQALLAPGSPLGSAPPRVVQLLGGMSLAGLPLLGTFWSLGGLDYQLDLWATPSRQYVVFGLMALIGFSWSALASQFLALSLPKAQPSSDAGAVYALLATAAALAGMIFVASGALALFVAPDVSRREIVLMGSEASYSPGVWYLVAAAVSLLGWLTGWKRGLKDRPGESSLKGGTAHG